MRILAHAHSNWSYDSSLSLSEWRTLAKALGVDTVLLTDHEDGGWTTQRYSDYVRACREASDSDVTLVPGLEFSQDGRHLLCYGLVELPPRPSSPAALAEAVRAQGRWLCLAHPAKYRWRFPDAIVAAVDAVEVWNSKWIYDGTLGPHPRTLALASGKLWLAGQDVHKRKHFSQLLMETPSPDVLADLAARRYGFVMAGSSISVESLAFRRTAGVVQRVRTVALRHALRGIRTWRRLKSGARPAIAGNGSRLRGPGSGQTASLPGGDVPKRSE
jgi:hypothetical protein